MRLRAGRADYSPPRCQRQGTRMTKNETPAPTGAKVQDPEGEGKPLSARPSMVPREAVVTLSLGESARIGVGLGRVRLWLSGHSHELHDEDLVAFDAAVALVKDVHDQIYTSALGDCAVAEMEDVIRDGSAENVYGRLAELIGVPHNPKEVGWIYKLARRCVAKLEHAKPRKG